MISRATLALANHRPENVAPALELMSQHNAVILEEPPDRLFQPMLDGRLPIDGYLQTLDIEYPEFSRRMAAALRKLHNAGTTLMQIEPYVQQLIQIHEFFAEGGNPSELDSESGLECVYHAEREATAALINFYRVSVQGTFEETVGAVKHFARADARRFLLRDQMRADAVAEVLKQPGLYYIEAGQIHYLLWRELRRRLPDRYPLSVKFVMATVVRELGLRGHLYGPGDQLTLLYIFHPDRRFREENLFAARALIYNKLITKEEIDQSVESYPHIRDELQTAAVVRQLSMEDCRHLFALIRRTNTDGARNMVRHFLKRTRKQSSEM